MVRACCTRLLGALLAGALATSAHAESPWSFRIGASLVSLEGGLATTYPASRREGGCGLAYRFPVPYGRIRTGLQFATLGGAGDVPYTGLVIDSTGFHQQDIGTLREYWHASWMQVPLAFEHVT